MQKRLFEDLIESDTVAHKTNNSKTLPVSIAIHAILLVLVIIVPLLTSEELPEPTSARVRSMRRREHPRGSWPCLARTGPHASPTSDDSASSIHRPHALDQSRGGTPWSRIPAGCRTRSTS